MNGLATPAPYEPRRPQVIEGTARPARNVEEVDWEQERDGGFRYLELGAVIVGEPSQVAWRRALIDLVEMDKSVRWWIGDLLIFGEYKWGTGIYADLESQTGIDAGTLANCKYIALRFPQSERRNVSWSHHALVAPLPTDKAVALLEEARDEGMSTRALKARISADLPEKQDDPTDFDQREYLLAISQAQEAMRRAMSFFAHRPSTERELVRAIVLELDKLDIQAREEHEGKKE